MPPLTPAHLVTEWSVTALLLLPALLAVGYVVLVVSARLVGTPWPVWRAITFVASTLVLAWSANGAPTAYRGTVTWMGTLSVGLTTAVVPLGLAIGDPVRLWENLRGRRIGWLRGRAARVLMFPVVASVVAAAVVTLVFTTGWYAAALTGSASWARLQVTVLVVGLLVNLPLLSEDLLPPWCTPALRALFAFTDGITDAVPGIVVMTTMDWVAGGALLAAAESVAVPMLFVIMAQWVRADEAEAREIDARLDRRDARRDTALTVTRADNAEPSTTSPPPGSVAASGAFTLAGGTVSPEPAVDRPWWESDPQLAHRFRRPPPPG